LSRKPYRHATSNRDKDLAVNADKGTWFCHRCGWAGSLKVKINSFNSENAPVYQPIKSTSKQLEEKNYRWFENRGITKEFIIRNKITQDKVYLPQTKQETPVICFNYYIADELVNIKYRDSEKNFMQVKNGAKVFYKINDLKDQSECIITEGEIDALSYEVAGYPNAISVPDGGINSNAKNIQTKLDYLDNCAEYFLNIKKVYLATDNDATGIRLREELARRLGKAKCYIVRFPDDCKDANEVLVKHGKDALINSITMAEPYPISGVRLAYDRIDEIFMLYRNGYPNGATTGWDAFDKHLRFHDSFLTVITGIPSHGKSNFLDNLMLRLAVKNGWKFGVFSPENGKIEIHVHRLAEILIGKPFLPNYGNRMTQDELIMALKWINENIFFIIPDNDEFSLTNILDASAYLVAKHGIKGLIIDPWNTIIHEYINLSETEYTKDILNRLIFFERNHGLHLFLVAHPAKMRKRKDSNQYEIPTLYDISGSANWYNKAEIGITIFREYSKDMNFTKQTVAVIQKVKHLFLGQTGTVSFQFDANCQRYYEAGNKEADNLWNILSNNEQLSDDIDF